MEFFVSSDEGMTFAEITGVEPSSFGFPVVVHPRQPDTAWFVPEIKDEKRIPREGKLVVNRTRDGGKTFEVRRWVCHRFTPMMSSIATRSRWMREAIGFPWDRRPAAFG